MFKSVFCIKRLTSGVLAQGKNVKSIIDDWNNELNAHSRAFMADAQSLAEWDRHIRRKRRELLEMEAHLNRVCLQHHLLICRMHYQRHIIDFEGNNMSCQHNNTEYHMYFNQLQLGMHVMAGFTGWTSKYCVWLSQTL